MQRYTVYFIWKLLYMFRVVPPPIIRSANNCIYSIWYLSHRYCYLPLSWKSWNWFECAVAGVRHPQHTNHNWFPGICLKVLSTATEVLVLYSRCQDRELNPEYLVTLKQINLSINGCRIISWLTLRRLMSYIYMEHPFLMFLDHTQRRSTVGRTPLDE